MATNAALIAAAAAEQQRKQQEEEELTEYTQEELNSEWEFKIVRANDKIFRKPEILSELIKEEAKAGWVMVEKFDNQRIRFKRSRNAQSNDASLPEGYDAYRTEYGPSVAIIILKVFGILGLIFGLAALAFYLLK